MSNRVATVSAVILLSAACASRGGVATATTTDDPAASPTPRLFSSPTVSLLNRDSYVTEPSECYWATGGKRAYCDRPNNRNLQGQRARREFRQIHVSFELEGSGYALLGAVIDGRLQVLYPASPDSIGWVGSRRLTRIQSVIPSDIREYPVFFLLTSKGPLNFEILSEEDNFVELQIDRHVNQVRSCCTYSDHEKQRVQRLKDYAPIIRDIADRMSAGVYAVWLPAGREATKWEVK